ncbi:hypothetical protein GA0070614_1690 [Micromonospora coxensis]|uniref:Uncharacterized protein n=1 Tax=Micromonospora coxensis TaxID=356852 RepID=A0A1C5HS24_9ACTN|nr:hypothetical protein GA0070614_1690 [Micromonospora coxensis]
MKAGDVLHLTRTASPQFVRPIFFRLIKIRSDLHTYDGWTWLDGYQLDKKGDASVRRELYVLKGGVKLLHSQTDPHTHAVRNNATKRADHM